MGLKLIQDDDNNNANVAVFFVLQPPSERR